MERAAEAWKKKQALAEKEKSEMRKLIKRNVPKVVGDYTRPATSHRPKIALTPEQEALFDQADAEGWTTRELAKRVGIHYATTWTHRTNRQERQRILKRSLPKPATDSSTPPVSVPFTE
jgi:DNA-binding NarL/FixJ family response regulator